MKREFDEIKKTLIFAVILIIIINIATYISYTNGGDGIEPVLVEDIVSSILN